MTITLHSAFKFYNEHCRTSNRSPESLKLNDYAQKLLLEYMGEDSPLDLIDRHKLRSFLLWLSDDRELAQSTAARIFDVLRALCNYLVEDELIETSPISKVKRPKADEVPIKVLTTEQIQSLLDACDGKTFTGTRNKLVIALLFDTGVRATELCSIELEDVDQVDRSILLRCTKGGKPRYAYYSATVAKLLAKYLWMRDSLLIAQEEHSRLILTETGTEVERYWLKNMIRRTGNRVGLRVHPHLLRHSCGVSMLINGADVFSVQRVLGHSTMAMTKHYSQMADKDVQDKHRLASPADRLVTSKRHSSKRGPKPRVQ